MAGSSFQPPINIDPTQTQSDQVSFINQNFQNLASELEANSFRIVGEGSFSVAQITINSTGTTYGDFNGSVGAVAHSLGYIPAFIAYMQQSNGVQVALPYTYQQQSGGTTATWQTYNPAATTTEFFISLRGLAFGGNWNSISGNVVKYYLLQEPAN